GILSADLDDLGDRRQGIREKLQKSPYVIAVFDSPSGTGLKVWFRVPPDASKHLGCYRTVEKLVLELAGVRIDQKCKDVSRLSFVSFDPTAHHNPGAIELKPLPLPEKPPHMEAKSELPADLPLRERIATELLGPLTWSQEKSGYFCKCPGEASHTNSTK